MSKRQPKTIATEVELLSGQRQSGESDSAVIACNDWLRMGVGRSLPLLHQKFTEFNQSKPPTNSLGTLKVWSMEFGWAERAAAYDATWEQRKNAERRAVMEYGISLDYERVRRLVRLANFLEAQIYELGEAGVYHNVWLPDVKGIGKGDDFERVDIERFNAALFEQYRKTLDDIAQETGGRVKQVKVDDWRSQAIADIRAGKIAFEALAQAFDRSLAVELFRSAGIEVE